MLPPGAFLNVAEESGLIVPLGAWTVREACARIADWSRREGAPRITVSVNLSARELTHPDIVPMVPGAVRRSGNRPSLLCIEVTKRGPGRPRLLASGLRSQQGGASSRSTTSNRLLLP